MTWKKKIATPLRSWHHRIAGVQKIRSSASTVPSSEVIHVLRYVQMILGLGNTEWQTAGGWFQATFNWGLGRLYVAINKLIFYGDIDTKHVLTIS